MQGNIGSVLADRYKDSRRILWGTFVLDSTVKI